jgi:hypothetical protein
MVKEEEEKRKLNKIGRLRHGTSMNCSKTAPFFRVFEMSA